MELHRKLLETLLRGGLLARGDAVLAGVSGGADSVALLHLLTEVAPALSLTLEVAHVEHGIRGSRSLEDAEFVRRITEGLSLPFHLVRLDLHGPDPRPGGAPASAGGPLPAKTPDAWAADLETCARDGRRAGNLEARARTERYRFFARVAAERCLGKVAVGHNRGDQVETMLMWLLRGCGPEGLAGMPAARPLGRDAAGAASPLLIRPLLEVSRDEILAYLASRGLKYREDHTNRDTRYLRNWVRRTLLPGLQEQTGTGLEHRLARLSGLLRSDNTLLERRTAEVYARVSRDGVLDRTAFLGIAPELRPRMVRFWLARVMGTLRRVGYAHVDAVLEITAGTRPHARVSLPGAWTVVREYESVRLVRPGGDIGEKGYCYVLPLEGEVEIPEVGVRVTAWCSERRERFHDDFEAAFDLSHLVRFGSELRLRNSRPGDCFQPLGMTGHKKLKNLFIDRKVPRYRRRKLPLLLVGEEILWIPGYARSDLAKVEVDTGTVWRVRCSPAPVGEN